MSETSDNTTTPELWLPLAEAAPRLGLSLDALRARVRRGMVTTRKGNDGRHHVAVPPESEHAEPDTGLSDEADELRTEIDELRAELGHAQIQAARLEAQLEAAGEVRAAQVGALRELADRLTVELATARAELAQQRRPWWRRWTGS